MRILTVLLLFLTSLSSLAQIEKCHTRQAIDQLEAKFPGYKDAAEKTFNDALLRAQLKDGNELNETLTIPVVFHVVYNTENQNLPEDIIRGQIETLNAHFSNTHEGANDVRPIFSSVVGNPEIQFELASIDPDGNSTNGIVRVETDQESWINIDFSYANILAAIDECGINIFSQEDLTDEELECILEFLGSSESDDASGLGIDNVKSTALGGSDPWDTESYLNIWICNLNISLLGGEPTPFVLGFAYPPVEAPNWPDDFLPENIASFDGVTLSYNAVGPNNPEAGVLAPTNDLGLAAVHEVGHYLGLRHIWGDGDCLEDDGLSDTPRANDSSQQSDPENLMTCSELHLNDTCTDDELPDMVENYMDYSPETCQNMFTQEQVAVMRAMLEGPRLGLLQQNSVGLNDNFVNEFSIFPNPSQHQIYIEHDLADAVSFRVTNVLGEILQVGSNVNQGIDVSTFSPGIHFLELNYKGKRLQKSFVVSH